MPRSICLNMIVKNECRVIERCLRSVRPILDSWAIVDTGSSDGTQELIKKTLDGIPGELFERPWRDFATNRNEAIELARARADYLVVIDADDVLVVPDRFKLPELTHDSYQLLVEYGATRYWRTHLFKGALDFKYVGVLHEVLVSDSARSSARLEGLVYRVVSGGARSDDPEKYKKDAAVLERALKDDPTSTRNAFYLAQSWRDAGELEKARDAYERRVAMAGWVEEVYVSLCEIAKLEERLGRDDDTVVGAYVRAYENRPSRVEPLCEAARFLRVKKRMAAAYPFARAASDAPHPDDVLFVDETVYAWRALDELAISAYYAGRYKEGLAANQRLLSGKSLPASERERVQKNLQFCRSKLK
jgi:glycosyltransferase involved in cell wall biosynthesis